MIILDPAKDERILRLGRTGEKKAPFPMHWTGSGVKIKTACVSLDVRLKAGYVSQAPWAAVLVDGAPVGRFCVARGRNGTTRSSAWTRR